MSEANKKFNKLLDILTESWKISDKKCITVEQCIKIVNILRNYQELYRSEHTAQDEKNELEKFGIKRADWHPCDVMERLRFGYVFGPDEDNEFTNKINSYWLT
jgi:hypothetical protein